MANAEQTSKPPWLQKALIVSLGLNLFLVGFLLAKGLTPADYFSRKPLSVNLSGLPQDIPPELRESLEDNFRKHSREVSMIYGDLIEARIVAREALQQEQLDEVALENALAEVRELQIKIQGPLHEALIDAAKELDAEMRRELVMFGETFDRGIWQPRNVDGVRWSVQFDNGELILNLQGITDTDDENEE